MNNKEKPAYYAVLPANVRYDKKLSPMAQLLYAEITALAQREGYAWASNKYFAELYNVHKDTVSRWMCELSEQGYVKVEVIKEAGYLRKVWITTPGAIGKNVDPIGKNAYSSRQKRLDPIGKNAYITLQDNTKKNRELKNKEIKAVDNSLNTNRASRATAQKVRDELARRGIVKPTLGSVSRVAALL